MLQEFPGRASVAMPKQTGYLIETRPGFTMEHCRRAPERAHIDEAMI